MEITNNYSDYGKGYTNTAKEGNVTTSTVELKTSTGGTKTEQTPTVPHSLWLFFHPGHLCQRLLLKYSHLHQHCS